MLAYTFHCCVPAVASANILNTILVLLTATSALAVVVAGIYAISIPEEPPTLVNVLPLL